ncbi:MAG: aminotransferase class I/II-fold pyridoxal phosphate-dependent enzyme [Clostridia bacterium]|nr:aminotransferase class I/II-fold pyridoxal phosphate-dependent enzyme [Clostridia bacterium]
MKDYLLNHAKENNVSFHMPGHKGSKIFRENGYGEYLASLVDMDVTEIPGADNLFQPEGIIRKTMDRYVNLYDSKESYLLINGSSAGIIASMMASAEEGKAIVMARNCHKSVFNGLSLGKIRPIYAYPEMVEGYGIAGEVKADEIARLLDENEDAQAVILPSPNYYGICSDIEKIAKECHKRGRILIVDQAHGAHLKMFSKFGVKGLPRSAEEQGADLVIDSIHKTLASFTQSALLNLCSNRVSKTHLEDMLQKIESTSPSYILMTALDMNADLLEKKGKELLTRWMDNIEYFYGEAEKIENLKVLRPDNLDFTKINLDMGMDGLKLEKILMDEGIYPELVTGDILMCMTGIGNTREDFDRLLDVLRKVSASYQRRERVTTSFSDRLDMAKVPKDRTWVDIDKAVGKVCAQSIIPYPPGIPIACPGEVLTEEVLSYVKALRLKGENVMGVDGNLRVCTGK